VAGLSATSRIPRTSSRSPTCIVQLISGAIPSYTLEKRYLRKDGQPIWVKVTASAARDTAGFAAYRIAVIEDINHRKLAEGRRQADEAKYRAIVDTAVDAIAVIDESGVIQSFNRSAEDIFGYPAAEVVGQNVRVLMPEPDRGRHDGYLANYRRTGQPKIIGVGREVQGRRKDGSLFPLELSIAEWRADGRRYFTGIMRDVTERKQAEEALRRLNETLERRVGERTAELEAANQRLTDQMEALHRAQTALQQAQKMEAIGQLTGGIAHDFNNLLAAISGNLHLMIGRAANDPLQLRLINATQSAAERGARLVEQLLAFARQQSLRPETVNLDELLREFAILITRSVGATIEVRFDGEAELWPVEADTVQFQSAVLNLAVNARDGRERECRWEVAPPSNERSCCGLAARLD